MKYSNRNYPRDEQWHEIHKHTTRCYRCDLPGEKKDFVILAYRVHKYNSHRIFARLCRDCFYELADEFDVTITEDV